MTRPSPGVCKVVTILCVLVLLLLTRFWIGRDKGTRVPVQASGGAFQTSGGAESRHTRCQRVFRVSDSRPDWEPGDPDTPGGCRSSILTAVQLPRCLERRRADTGRRTLIVFLGDSRARIHFERLRAELRLRWEGRPIQEVFREEFSLPELTPRVLGSPERCLAGHTVGVSLEDRVLRLACDQSASDRLLRAQFFWHPHVNTVLLRRLSELAEACDGGRHSCPDVVVLTSGMWYAKSLLERAEPVPPPQRVLELRRDAVSLADHPRLLAARTQLVYRPDPPEMTEILGQRSAVGGVLAAINVLMFGIIKQAGGGAQVWTSSLVDSVRFYHSVCLPLSRRADHASDPLWQHCRDPLHAGGPVRRNAVCALLSFVCCES